MANTLNLGNGNWATKEDSLLAYNSENGNFKPLPFSFSRASSATVVNKAGLIETVGSGEPRIDYKDDSKGALKLEPSRSNAITYSNDFLDSSWNVFRGSVTADVIISPDGTQNALRYEEDSQTGSHLFRRQSLSVQNGLSYTGSIFIKKGELTSIILQSNSSSRWVASATFDVENGLVTSGTGVIEDYGNGWYRCSISGNAVQTTTVAGLEMYTSVGAGRDEDGLYMYGSQFEQGSYATSYIPTQGSAVTRVADSCSQTPPSGIIGQTEGTVFLKSNNLHPSGTRTLAMLYTSGSAFYQIYLTSSNQIRVDVNGSLLMLSSAIDLSISNKIAFAYKSAENALYLNGVSLATSTSTSTPSSLNDFQLGNFNGNEQSGSFTSSKFYNTRLSNAELQALTS